MLEQWLAGSRASAGRLVGCKGLSCHSGLSGLSDGLAVHGGESGVIPAERFGAQGVDEGGRLVVQVSMGVLRRLVEACRVVKYAG